MSFISTRGGACVTASQAILRGLAPDGGLYVPAVFPQMTLADIAALTKLDYRARALTILRGYLDDFNAQELADAIASAYEAAKFDDAAIAPTKKLDSNTHVLELFHGPTLAFKDMALQLLPHLTTLSAKKNGENREVAILVATSGDTGKAALEGFKDVPETSCTVFYPTDGVSDVQKLQMTTTGGENTHVIALNGNFDDAQSGVKALFSSADFHQQVNARGKVLSSANSINFGRLVPQIVYYFSAYADLLNAGAIALGDEVNFVVPTGNFGNILAGYYARSMGLPVKKLICASNSNNVLTDFLATGTYDKNRPFHTTMSPSMDILVSSNLERLLFALSGQNDQEVAGYMKQLGEKGCYTVSEEIKAKLQADFYGGFCDEAKTSAIIAQVWKEHHYLIDPHTAVAYGVMQDYREATGDDRKTVFVSTASPFKFCDSVLHSLGVAQVREGLGALDQLAEVSGRPAPVPLASLRDKAVRFEESVDKEKMMDVVLDMLR